jgi:hypothetical protein
VFDIKIIHRIRDKLTQNNYDYLIQLSICLSLFVLSIVIRTIIRTWFLSNFNVIPYVSAEGWYWETYRDADTYYQHYIYSFKYESWNPYRLDREWPLSGYVYGPIFVYCLVFLSYFTDLFYPGIPRLHRAWKAVVFAPTFFDSLTTILIYLILLKSLKKGKRNKINVIYSLLAAISYIFMPLVLFYNNIMFLNTYMVAFFSVLSFYFLHKGKHQLSGGILALAILTKLIAFFLIPIWFLYLLRNDIRKGIEFLLSTILTMIIFSLPWLVMNPFNYIYQQVWPGQTLNTVFSIDPRWIYWATTPTHAFLYWGWENVATFYYQFNSLYLPLFFFILVSCIIVMLKAPHMNLKRSSFFSFNAMFTIGFHIFLSRGNYKYYDTFFIPFVIIAITEWVQNFKRKEIGVTLFVLFMGWIIFLNIWIIIKIKWLHIFFTFLIFLTILFTYNLEMHLAVFHKTNYTNLWLYIKDQGRKIKKIKKKENN